MSMDIYQLNINDNLPVVHLQFFPSVAQLVLFEELGEVSIDIYENFPKQTFRNRAVLLSSQGLMNIIVPVKSKGKEKQVIKDVEISYSEKWNVEMWRTIFSCYGKSPYFMYYADKIEQILMEKHKYLMDLNLEVFLFLKKSMNLSCELHITSQYIQRQENNFRDMFLPKNRIENGKDLPAYYQCFDEKFSFQTNLSALDLLFNLGNQSLAYIKSASR